MVWSAPSCGCKPVSVSYAAVAIAAAGEVCAWGADLRLQAGERVVRGGRDRRRGRGVRRRGGRGRVRPEVALDGHRRVVDGDVHDAHQDGGLAGELGAEVLRAE